MTDLHERKAAPSSTERTERKRCPECKGVNIRPQCPESPQSHGEGRAYRCDTCETLFDEPTYDE